MFRGRVAAAPRPRRGRSVETGARLRYSYWPKVVASGDVAWARELLARHGADANWPLKTDAARRIKAHSFFDKFGFALGATVLMMAVLRQDAAMVELLVDHGAAAASPQYLPTGRRVSAASPGPGYAVAAASPSPGCGVTAVYPSPGSRRRRVPPPSEPRSQSATRSRREASRPPAAPPRPAPVAAGADVNLAEFVYVEGDDSLGVERPSDYFFVTDAVLAHYWNTTAAEAALPLVAPDDKLATPISVALGTGNRAIVELLRARGAVDAPGATPASVPALNCGS